MLAVDLRICSRPLSAPRNIDGSVHLIIAVTASPRYSPRRLVLEEEATRVFDRRRILNWLLGGSAFAWAGSVIHPIVKYLLPPPEQEAAISSVKAATLTEMAPNSGKIFKFGRKPALIVRRPDGTFGAFLAKCTHLDCIVQYREDKERIWCACHDGFYDLNGTNVAGPPPRPLDVLEVHMQGDDVYVTRKS